MFALGIIAFVGVLLVVGKPEQAKDSAAIFGSGLVFFRLLSWLSGFVGHRDFYEISMLKFIQS